MVNKSKVNDPRYQEKWKKSGALETFNDAYMRSTNSKRNDSLKFALMHAGKDTISDEDSMNNSLGYAQEHSETPIPQSVIKMIRAVYEEHEPERSKEALRTAIRCAKRGHNSKWDVNSWVGYAQKHSKTPISEASIGHVYTIYEEHEPERRDNALESALRCAKLKSTTNIVSMEYWLGEAQEHSRTPIDSSVIENIRAASRATEAVPA